jgi:ABC-type amino acid transport substrate-binding protein
MAEVGDVTMTAETIWLTEINSSAFFISDPVVARGEFEEGFFVKPDDVAIKKVKTLDELRKYRAVSNENWIHDWMALKDMKIDAVSSPTQEQIFKMIYARHADFTMQNFTTAKDLGIEVGGIYLVPIPGIKIAFMESRHFVISKKAPDAEKLYKALQSGLKKMRSNGTIKRALVESGFLNLRVKNWKKLNP